jgi:hypothetical protein
MLTDSLRTRVRNLASSVRGHRGLLGESLAKRLDEIAGYAGADLSRFLRGRISPADWNYFQQEVNSNAAMADAFRRETASYAAAIAADFEARLAEARAAQSVIDELVRIAWYTPLSQ